MANYLAVSLRGSAQGLLNSLHPAERDIYGCVVKALKDRFGTEGQTETFKAHLLSRTKGQKETFMELGEDIIRLVGEAYPTAKRYAERPGGTTIHRRFAGSGDVQASQVPKAD